MAEETIYLCNFRVSVDGDWLCLRELSDVHLQLNQVQSPESDGEIKEFYLNTVLPFLIVIYY